MKMNNEHKKIKTKLPFKEMIQTAIPVTFPSADVTVGGVLTASSLCVTSLARGSLLGECFPFFV